MNQLIALQRTDIENQVGPEDLKFLSNYNFIF